MDIRRSDHGLLQGLFRHLPVYVSCETNFIMETVPETTFRLIRTQIGCQLGRRSEAQDGLPCRPTAALCLRSLLLLPAAPPTVPITATRCHSVPRFDNPYNYRLPLPVGSLTLLTLPRHAAM